MNKKKLGSGITIKEKLHDFRDLCRARGLRVTPQRTAIYRELLISGEHPSAVVVHKKVRRYYPTISLGTVNSTLLMFAEIGLAKIVESSGDPKRFDQDLKPHHHFKCVKCGRIIDFNDKSFDDLKVPPEIKKRYKVLGKKVHLEGLCDKCK
jgi:Fur family peroxide stress response transcriptional regulator